MTLDKNSPPYYDDYDKEKNYYQILFKPGVAVQARELSQMQAILQQQIKNFGDSIYKTGSMVLPGESAINIQYPFVKLEDQFESVDINISNFADKQVIGLTSGTVGTVLQTEETDGVDPNTLYVQYQVGNSSQSFTASITDNSKIVTAISISASAQLVVGALVTGTGIPSNTYIVSVDSATQITMSEEATATNGSATLTVTTADQFEDGETIATVGEVLTHYATVQTSGTGYGAAAIIKTGVYFIEGYFVLVTDQIILLDKYTNTPTYRIGLNYIDEFITANTDSTLNDPAAGSSNFNAPGADRYYINLLLTKLGIEEDVPENFIELINIKDGEIQSQVTHPSYSILEQTLARRTYDESGDYTTKPFQLQVKEHLNDGTNFGVYSASDGGDEDKLVLAIAPGKAYVKGYEIQTQSTTLIEQDKARTTLTTINLPFSFSLGNYVDCDTVTGTFNLTGYDTVTLKDNVSATVGTALVRGFKLVSGTPGDPTAKYRLWLFKVDMTGSHVFSEVNKITASGKSATVIADSATPAALQDVADNIALLQIPAYAIKTFKNEDNSITNEYSVRRYFSGTMSGNSITLTAGSNGIFQAFDVLRYHLSITSASATAISNGFVTGDVVDLTDGGNSVTLSGSPSGAQVIITVPTINGSGVAIIASLLKTDVVEKTKTLTTVTETVAHSNLIQLTHADGYKIISVTEADSNAKDITDLYILDGGQRDNYYDRSTLLYNTNYAIPNTANVSVEYEYFAHGTGDFFSVDSYNGVIDYHDIPAYKSTSTGKVYDLINCLDFRPRINDAGSGFSVSSEIVEDAGDFTVTYDYYTGRIDKLYLDYLGNFKLISGANGINPQPPKDPDDGMVIYTIKVPPYTFKTSDVIPTALDNRGYTMRDIGKIDKRVTNLEYYTALSLLEQNTADMFIDDGTGQNRFKNGFMVDNFSSLTSGDVSNPDFKCSIDPQYGFLRPSFFSDNVPLILDTGNSTFYTKTGDLITLPYTVASFIKQPYASDFENINPYNIFNWIGSMTLTPASDDWYDTKQAPDRVITTTDDAAIAAAQALNGQVTWNDWTTTWVGAVISDTVQPQPSNKVTTFSPGAKASIQRIGDAGPGVVASQAAINASFGGRTPDNITGWIATNNGFRVSGTITTTHIISQQQGQTRTGTQLTVVPTTTQKTIGNVVVSTESIPFMREKTLSFSATGLKANTTIYPFFNNVAVTAYCTPTGGSLGGQLRTDINGAVSGTFAIPNNTSVKFRTGTATFTLIDSQTNDTGVASTVANAIFESAGTIQTQQSTILSTQTAKIVNTTVSENRTIVGTNIQTSTQNIQSSWYDPLAQSFLVNSIGGVFLNKINIYFKTKDAGNIPVMLQVRTLVNGYPGPNIVPYSEVTINPSAITTSTDGSVATSFTFPSPVYLNDATEYCFTLLSNSNSYNVWVSKIGLTDIATGARISNQPYAGSLFKSQNASTWTAAQEEDIKFEIFRCVFDTAHTGTVVLNNDAVDTITLPRDPFTTTEDSGTGNIITVYHPNHTLRDGQTTTITGVDGDQNGIPDTELNAEHTITMIDYDYYTFVVSSHATAAGNCGGSEVEATRNIRMDLTNIISQNLTFAQCALNYGIKTRLYTDGSLDSEFSDISVNKNVYFEDAQVIESEENVSGHSVIIEALMETTIDSISPVLDSTRQSVIAVGNRINNDDTDETEPAGGNAIAKYITAPIVLATSANHINLYFAAIRPANCEIEVYIKTLSNDKAGSETFPDQEYVLLDEVDYPNYDASSFYDYQFSLENMDDFSSFAIKIVMIASDTADACTIKQFRVVATAT